MKKHVVVDRFMRSLISGVMAVGFVASALAEPGRSAGGVTIAVLDDRYIVGDLAFDDLDTLERYITAAPLRSVVLYVCGTRATRSLKAVVHRFRQVPVQMRLPDADDRECMSRVPLVVAVRERDGQRPFGIDDEAVERYWMDLMP